MDKETKQQIIQHLAFEPKIRILNYKNDYVGIEQATAVGFYYLGDDLCINYTGGSTGKIVKQECLLQLRPMSQLNEEIEQNGNRFIPVKMLDDDGIYFSETYKEWSFEGDYLAIDMTSITNKLMDWGFDITGLINTRYAEPIPSL